MPPKQPTYDQFFGSQQIAGDVPAEQTRILDREARIAAGLPADLGPAGHADSVIPYQDRLTQLALDEAAVRSWDVVDRTLPTPSPELSARRTQKLGEKILKARELAHNEERREKVMEWSGRLMLLHTSWPGVLKYDNPLRPTTASERYGIRRMDTWLRKSRVAANKRAHYGRTDNGRPVALRESMANYAAGPPPPDPNPPRLSAHEAAYKARLAKHAKGTFVQRHFISPRSKANRFDKAMESRDWLARGSQARARDLRAYEARITRKYTGATPTTGRRVASRAGKMWTGAKRPVQVASAARARRRAARTLPPPPPNP